MFLPTWVFMLRMLIQFFVCIIKILKLLTFPCAYFCTTVCQEVSTIQILTFFNYLNQSQNSSPVQVKFAI